jgi:oligopeptide/dipeptide ABC transporter ATP-binding protein
MSILDIQDLCVRIGPSEKEVFALNGVTLKIAGGEVHALVGETGAGKSMLAKSIMRLLPDSALVSGNIFVDGIDCLKLNSKEVTAYRGSVASIALQNPRSCLSATRTIGDQLVDRISNRTKVSKKVALLAARNLLESVGISDTKRTLQAFPHQMSGGMCQRIMIALAISSKPRLLIADEPTNSLDATLTENILQLIYEYSKKENAAVLIISHDIASVAAISDKISVLYAGSIVEQNRTEDLLGKPHHPYTKMLLDSVPKMDGLAVFSDVGSMPILSSYPTGCAFKTRCNRATNSCSSSKPALVDLSDLHSLACFNPLDPTNIWDSTQVYPAAHDSKDKIFGNVILSLKSVNFIYKGRFGIKGFKAIDNLDLEVYEGENLGIVGESGSGKSTLGRILSGLEKVSSGELSGVVAKQKLFRNIFQNPIRDEIQMVFQDPILTHRSTISSTKVSR